MNTRQSIEIDIKTNGLSIHDVQKKYKLGYNEASSFFPKKTLKEIVIEEAELINLKNKHLSDKIIRVLTKQLYNKNWAEKEILETQQYVKEIIKVEIVSELTSI